MASDDSRGQPRRGSGFIVPGLQRQLIQRRQSARLPLLHGGIAERCGSTDAAAARRRCERGAAYFVARLIDPMEINLVPTLLGSGERLIERTVDRSAWPRARANGW